MAQFSRRDQHCYIVFGYAPEGVSIRDANHALNAFIADPRRGSVLFHDHFVGRAGGVALFWVETAEELAALQDPGPLAGWELRLHPLIFASSPVSFLYQMDFTMTVYRHRRLKDLIADYEASALVGEMDKRALL